MKIVYITSYSFPSTKAEPYHVKSLARAFTEHLGQNALLVVYGTPPAEFDGIQAFPTKTHRRFRTLFYFFWFVQFIHKEKLMGSDVVFFSNDPYLLLIFVFWRTILFKKYKVCADLHLLFEDWKDTLITRYSDYLVSTTERLKSLAVTRCGTPPNKILVAYGGVDHELLGRNEHVEKELLRKEFGLPSDSFLVGYVGTFRSLGLEKGIGTMLRALPQLPEHVRMVFVGGTRDQIPEYAAIAKELGVLGRCMFIERQPFAKIMQYELAMDILTIPYPNQPHFRDYGFPIKVWEYMASGRPIVYSDLAIISEVLKGRGTPFTPDSPESLAKKIMYIAHNYEETERVSKKNTILITEYTWSKKGKKIIEFFKAQK